MNDEQIELFLNLKFSNMKEVLDAFAEATDVPTNAFSEDVIKIIDEWATQGAPKKLNITDGNVIVLLKAKFGSIKKAYDHWISFPQTHGLSDIELQIVMDYIDCGHD